MALSYGTTAAGLAARLGPLASTALKAIPYLGTALTVGSIAKLGYDVVKSRYTAPTDTPAQRAQPAKTAKQEMQRGAIKIGPDSALRTLPMPELQPCKGAQGLSKRVNKQRPRKKRRAMCPCDGG